MNRRIFWSVALAAILGPGASGGALLAQGESPGASSASKLNLDLPAEALAEEAVEEEAPETVVLAGQVYEGNAIVFCLDKSGSMREGNKFRMLQREVIKTISQLSARVQFGMVFFDASLVKFPGSGRPVEASEALKAAGIAFVISTWPGPGTCSKPALISALRTAGQSSARGKHIFYLSDGLHGCCPGHGSGHSEGEDLDEVTALNAERIPIHAVCIGSPGTVEEDWMMKLATMNNGSFLRILGNCPQ